MNGSEKSWQGKLILLVIPTAIVVLWFSKGLMFGGGEEGIPLYNLNKSLHDVSYVWHEYNGGVPMIWLIARLPFHWFLSLLSSIGFSNVFLQALIFLALMLVGMFSVYYLIKDLFDERFSLVGSILYLLNPYSLVLVWGRGLYVQFFAFALIPVFLLLFTRAISKNSIYYASLSVLSTFVLSAAFVFPAQLLVVWFSPVLYLFFYLRRNKTTVLRSLFLFFLILFFFLMVHAWWIGPYLELARVQYATLLDDPEHNLGSLRGVSREIPFFMVIRLLHNFVTGAKIYGEIYMNIIFQIISLFAPVALILAFSKVKGYKYGSYFIVLFLVALFVVLGSNLPFGFLFEFIFMKITFLQAFRNPYEKFGVVYLLAFVPSLAIGLGILSEKIAQISRNKIASPKNVMYVLLLLYCGVYVWPIWTGQFAGGLSFNPWVKVPGYYNEANDWLNGQAENFRIIQMPLIPGDGLRYNWPNSYQGIEASEYLFDVPSIGRNTITNKTYYNILLGRFGNLSPNSLGPDPDISESEFASEELYQELEKLNVRYIILHNDIDSKLAGSKTYEETLDYLSKQKNIQKINSFGELDIFQVQFSGKTTAVFSPQVKTEFKKINPTYYKVYVKDVQTEADLYFLDLFDERWEAFVDGEKLGNHERVYSYANKWKLNKPGTYEIVLRYTPQDLVVNGLKISFVALSILFLSGIFWSRKLSRGHIQ